ncbi:MAG: hypothetical protein DYH04_14950 [Nitrospira sp. NTP2]|nr:hypothetical protein [Nitrospira sp. NTP2]
MAKLITEASPADEFKGSDSSSPPESEATPVSVAPIDSPDFLRSASQAELKERLSLEVSKIISRHYPTDKNEYCFLSLYDTRTSIDSWDADRIFRALQAENPERKKNVILFLVSNGGKIEPAYQITKICKKYSTSLFQVVIPRRAKSAATLMAIGADIVHMGPFGELGPIDPQLDGLPALGVRRSLEIIAGICASYPKSSDAFAKYLGSKLTIEQIGYCDRVSESAAQYAERLLQKKPGISASEASLMAKRLVYEYKDHGFVIDVEEAQNHLGSAWIKSDSREINFGEAIYNLFETLNLMLQLVKNKRMLVNGSLMNDTLFWDIKD